MEQTKRNWWPIVIIVILVLLVVGISFGNKSNQPISIEPIKIGFIGPLSGVGVSYGEGERNAITTALKEINDNGGVLGRKIEVVYEDSKCSGQDAVTAVQKLINIDQVKIILGGACSGETIAAATITEPAKVILFSAFSTSPDISNSGDFVFRNTPSDKDIARAVADIATENNQMKVAILTENTDFGKTVRENIIKRLGELNATVVADETYNMDSKDYRAQLTKIKSAKPDAVIFNPQSGVSGGLAVKQAKELGINVPYYGNFGFSSGDAMKTAGVALNGMKFGDAPSLNKDNPIANKFMTEYLKLYPKPSSDWEVGARYDSVYIIANAIKSCKGTDTECIKNYLYKMSDYTGVLGKYHFDANGDPVGMPAFAVKQIVDALKEEVVTIQ